MFPGKPSVHYDESSWHGSPQWVVALGSMMHRNFTDPECCSSATLESKPYSVLSAELVAQSHSMELHLLWLMAEQTLERAMGRSLEIRVDQV